MSENGEMFIPKKVKPLQHNRKFVIQNEMKTIGAAKPPKQSSALPTLKQTRIARAAKKIGQPVPGMGRIGGPGGILGNPDSTN